MRRNWRPPTREGCARNSPPTPPPTGGGSRSRIPTQRCPHGSCPPSLPPTGGERTYNSKIFPSENFDLGPPSRAREGGGAPPLGGGRFAPPLGGVGIGVCSVPHGLPGRPVRDAGGFSLIDPPPYGGGRLNPTQFRAPPLPYIRDP